MTKRLDRWSQILENDIIRQTVNNRMDQLYDRIYSSAPKRTGYLRSTIKMVSESEGKFNSFSMITVTARYAIYVDQGRSPRGARKPVPFWSGNVVGFSIELINAVREVFRIL